MPLTSSQVPSSVHELPEVSTSKALWPLPEQAPNGRTTQYNTHGLFVFWLTAEKRPEPSTPRQPETFGIPHKHKLAIPNQPACPSKNGRCSHTNHARPSEGIWSICLIDTAPHSAAPTGGCLTHKPGGLTTRKLPGPLSASPEPSLSPHITTIVCRCYGHEGQYGTGTCCPIQCSESLAAQKSKGGTGAAPQRRNAMPFFQGKQLKKVRRLWPFACDGDSKYRHDRRHLVLS